MNGFHDHDELYWNAIGEEWDVPIERATTRPRAGRASRRWPVSPGRRGRHCLRPARANGATRASVHDGLPPFQALRSWSAFRKALWPSRAALEERWSLGRAFSATPVTLGASGGCSSSLIGGCGWLLWRRGRDRRFVGSPVDQVLGNATGEHRRCRCSKVTRRAGGVRAAGGSAAGSDWHARRRAGERARRHGDDRRSGGSGLPDDRGDPEGGVVRQAPTGRSSHRQGRADLLTYERTLLRGLFRDGNELTLSELKTHVLRAAAVRAAVALHGRGQARLVREAPRQGSGVVACARSRAVRRRSRLTFILAKWTTFGLAGIPVAMARRCRSSVGRSRMPGGPRRARRCSPRRGVPDGDRDRRDAHVTVGGEAERVHPLPAVRDRVRVHGQWAKAFEGLGRCRPTHVVPLEPAVHLRGLRASRWTISP